MESKIQTSNTLLNPVSPMSGNSPSPQWRERINLISDALLQRALSIPSELAMAASVNPWLEREILYPRYQKRLIAHQPKIQEMEANLSAMDQKIVNTLRQDGICVTSLTELDLPLNLQLWHGAQAVASQLAHLATTPKYATKHTLTGEAHQLTDYPAIFWWGAQERLLHIVEAYLGLPVAYDSLSFYYSLADGRHAGPRKWHRDREDWRMIKIGIYLNDVDEFGGPFECTTPEANQFLREHVDYPFQVLKESELRQRWATQFGTDDQEESLLEKPWRKTCTGKAGTVIFVDTATYYHRGKPPVHQDRAALFFGYFAQHPQRPFICERSPLSRYQIRELSQNLSPAAQKAALWTNYLPPIVKFFPKNRLKV